MSSLRGINLSWTCALVSILVCANAASEDELRSFVLRTKFEYEDPCSKAGESEWAFINDPNETTRRLWETAVNEFRLQKVKGMNGSRALGTTNTNDTTLEYAYQVARKPGDALLESDDYRKLVSFAGQAEISRLTGYYTTATDFRQDVERRLARDEKAEDKLASWLGWHQTLAPLAANFPENLQLVQKAAVANGESSVERYWEMLSGFENGYDRIKTEWHKLRTLNDRFQKIVKKSLDKKYGISEITDGSSAHLLGSLQGNDWTNTAMDIIDPSEIVSNMTKSLTEKGIGGETLYKEASADGKGVLLEEPQADFWTESNFHGQCPSHLVNLCRGGKMRVSTCSEASIGNYITAHKNIGKILVNQMSRKTDPILGIANRHSALEEGVAELFGILSINRDWLRPERSIGDKSELEDNEIVELMITARDVIPRMSYYMAADMWRINAMRNNITDPSNLTSTWWKYRLEYENVNTSVPDLPTFLDDDYITGNKPYLPKILGIMLGFKLYEYVVFSSEIRYDTVALPLVQHHHRFFKMMEHSLDENWTEVLKKNFDLSQINADSMLSYFSPLMDHLEVLEMSDWFDRPVFSDDKDEIVNTMQSVDKKETNDLPTTTTNPLGINETISKPVETKPTLPTDLQVNDTTKIDDLPTTTTNPLGINDTTSEPVETKPTLPSNIPSNSSKSIDEIISDVFGIPFGNKTIEDPKRNETVKDDGTEITDEKPKKKRNKAVWVVGAILVVTFVIGTLLIFGPKWTRVPKNRRFG